MATVTIATRERNGGKSYIVQYQDPQTGKKRHYVTFRLSAQARQEANRLRATLDAGDLPPSRRQTRKALGSSFQDVAEACRAEWRRRGQEGSLSQATVAGYLYMLDALCKAFGPRLVAHISRDDILNYRAQVSEKHTPVLANRRLFVLKQVMARAKADGGLREDPAAAIRYLSEKAHERNELMMPEKVDQVLRAAEVGPARHYLPLAFLLAVEHGASRQEILDLTWADVHLDHGATGVIRFLRTKNGVERMQAIMPRTRQALLVRRDYLAAERLRKGVAAVGDRVVGRLDGSRMNSFRSASRTSTSTTTATPTVRASSCPGARSSTPRK